MYVQNLFRFFSWSGMYLETFFGNIAQFFSGLGWEFLVGIPVAYLMGSIAGSWIVGKVMRVDLRDIGSKSTGATNLARERGWKAGLLGLFLDTIKSAIVVWIAWHILDLPLWQVTVLGGVAILGHLYPIFLSFRGGKGIATAGGVLWVLNPLAIAVALLVWLVVCTLTKYSSLGSLLGALSVSVAYVLGSHPWAADNSPMTIFSLVLLALIVYTHRGNIKRLWRGEESKVNFKRVNAS